MFDETEQYDWQCWQCADRFDTYPKWWLDAKAKGYGVDVSTVDRAIGLEGEQDEMGSCL